MSKKGFEFLPLAINEKTNIKETTRYLKNLIKQLTVNVEIKKANKSKLPQVHVVLKGAMDERLKAMGIKNVADFLFLMQYTGLARYYRVYIDAKPATVWEVVRYDFFKQLAKKRGCKKCCS